MKRVPSSSCDEVLDAFAAEKDSGRVTLERYLREYPEFAGELLDLAGELLLESVVDEAPLSPKDNQLIAAAWNRHVKAEPKVAANPFARLSIADLRKVAEVLEIPRQVLTAFRDRAVVVASVPKRFLERLASAIDSTFDALTAYLEVPTTLSLARSHKAESKPRAGQRVTFEQLLVDAGVPAQKQKQLMAED